MKACSTLVAFFALVSKNGICSWSANSFGTNIRKQSHAYTRTHKRSMHNICMHTHNWLHFSSVTPFHDCYTLKESAQAFKLNKCQLHFFLKCHIKPMFNNTFRLQLHYQHSNYTSGPKIYRCECMNRRADLCCCEIHDLLVHQVALVSYQELADICAGVAINLLQPRLHVLERLLRAKPERQVTRKTSNHQEITTTDSSINPVYYTNTLPYFFTFLLYRKSYQHDAFL